MRAVVLVLASLVLLGLPAAADATARIAWAPCFTEVGPFECGTARVPLDYDQPRGAHISIALTRLPATDRAHRIGSLFVNPGGPGGSGVDMVVGEGQSMYSNEVRARFDIVGFDPRGILRSTALQCFDSPDDWGPYFTDFLFPLTREQLRIWIDADRYLTSACRDRAGPILDHVSTANVARDLDVLRAAVGDAKLTFVGQSYGTYIGQTYANLFPSRVRALVLDSVMDPIAYATGRSPLEGRTVPAWTRLHPDKAAQTTLNEFFRLCDAGNCAFGPHSARRFATLAQRLLTHPVDLTFPDGSTFTVDYTTLIGIMDGELRDSAIWSDTAQLLADLETASATTPPPRIAARLQAAARRRPAFAADDFYPNFVEGLPGVSCTDTDNPHDYAAWWINGKLADARNGYFGSYWTWINSPCAEWPGRDRDRYMRPWTARTANPVLLVNDTFDPATRIENAVLVNRLLPRSVLLTVHAWGHVSLFRSQCADAAVSRYLLNITTPPRGSRCEQDVVPFTDG